MKKSIMFLRRNKEATSGKDCVKDYYLKFASSDQLLILRRKEEVKRRYLQFFS
jgi:hypothetical protein